MPLAAIGAIAYFAVFSLATLAAFGYAMARPLLGALVFAMLGVTLWLLYLQAFVLRAFCEYCLLSAAVTFTLSGLATLL
ncbi:vitamin K epoxide reductase family protein, partial [Acinetobacter baumannii]